MSCLDRSWPSENCALSRSAWFMREPPILIEPEKAYHRSLELRPPHKATSPAEAMSNKSIVPHENDVLMGRGGKNNQHIGNEKLRALARVECENYRLASKKGKSYISRELVKKVRDMQPPGRFLKRNQKTGEWEDVGDEVGREKASQVLRDAVSSLTGQPGTVSKNVSESAESSEHEGQQEENDETRKRQRSESASTLEQWPAPPRTLSVGAPTTKQHQQQQHQQQHQHQYLQPEAYPITPVSPSRTKRQRNVYYPHETYSPEQPISPITSPYIRHPHEATFEHSQPPQLPPPPPSLLHHYSHGHHQPNLHHMHHPYDYPPMPPPGRTEYSVPPIPLRPHSSSYPPRGYPTWTGGYQAVPHPPQPPPPGPGPGPDVNEFDLFQGELLESDDEAKHPDIHRSESF